MKIKEFFVNMAKGAVIGLAMIIPGVSGGTVAVLLKIYDKMIDAVGSLKSKFKESILFLLPIALGIVLAFAAAYFPLTLALKHAPFPTMLLFAGLMAGSCPKLIADSQKKGYKRSDNYALLLPFALVIGLCFIPGLGNANLAPGMDWYQYILVLIMGIVASCALVVPGISGSMLLMIFGYYEPVLGLFSSLLKTPGHSIAVLALFAVGIVIGFFTIAKLMQLLLNRFPRVTGWAICGFVLGSIPAIILTFFNKYKEGFAQYLTTLHICLGVALFILGAAASFFLTRYAEKFIAVKKERAAVEETAAGEECEYTAENQVEDNLPDGGEDI